MPNAKQPLYRLQLVSAIAYFFVSTTITADGDLAKGLSQAFSFAPPSQLVVIALVFTLVVLALWAVCAYAVPPMNLKSKRLIAVLIIVAMAACCIAQALTQSTWSMATGTMMLFLNVTTIGLRIKTASSIKAGEN